MAKEVSPAMSARPQTGLDRLLGPFVRNWLTP
ncbi:hypothetical protein GALL_480930 [mine drainage metagenome]|uniref:Uncharacterized protein n=1 Tax=mine drainage metagenome TaxID=410659 RepID=A0A1J5PHN8_9ZZZZ